jgi:hypothetical protein
MLERAAGPRSTFLAYTEGSAKDNPYTVQDRIKLLDHGKEEIVLVMSGSDNEHFIFSGASNSNDRKVIMIRCKVTT